MMRARALFAFALLLACGTPPPDAPANETDPAITDALNDPIMADPRLELQHGGGSVSVPTGIDAGSHAQTLGQVAALALADAAFAGCDPAIAYGFQWMARLPADLALPPSATVSEAAGSDAAECKLRIIRYAVARPVAAMTADYRVRGYALSVAEGGVIRGLRASDGAAYRVAIAPTANGATIDFVTNRGR